MFATLITDPQGAQWAVRLHIIPDRKGVGFRARFLHRKKRDPNKGRWYDFIDIPFFDGIDDLWLLLILIVVVVVFVLIGWPLILLLADFIWLILALLTALVVYGVLGRPVTISASSADTVHTWKIRGLAQAFNYKKTIAHNLAHGIVLDDRLTSGR